MRIAKNKNKIPGNPNKQMDAWLFVSADDDDGYVDDDGDHMALNWCSLCDDDKPRPEPLPKIVSYASYYLYHYRIVRIGP